MEQFNVHTAQGKSNLSSGVLWLDFLGLSLNLVVLQAVLGMFS